MYQSMTCDVRAEPILVVTCKSRLLGKSHIYTNFLTDQIVINKQDF